MKGGIFMNWLNWLGPAVFIVGALMVGLGLTFEKSGTLLIIGLVFGAAGYVIMRIFKSQRR